MLEVSRVSPKIRLTRMAKKMLRIRLAFSASKAYGSTM